MQVKNGSYEEPYTDPGAPVHIVTGAAVSELLYWWLVIQISYVIVASYTQAFLCLSMFHAEKRGKATENMGRPG